MRRDQGFLLPPDMREWLPADHLVWFLLEVIAAMDTSVFARRPRRREQGPDTGSTAGRAGYDPDLLLGLLIYAYANGLQSSRRIERLCHTDVAFRVLCAGDIPDHTVIARFRAAHQEKFVEVFAQVLRLCARAGLGQVGTVAIDGSKFTGDASPGANHGRDWFARQAAERVEAAAATDAAEGQRLDAGGDPEGGDRGPAGWAEQGAGDRQARIQTCLAELEDAGQSAQADLTAKAAKLEVRVQAREADVARLRAEQQTKIDRWHQGWADHRARPLFYYAPQGACPRPVDKAVVVVRAEAALARARAKAEHLARQLAAASAEPQAGSGSGSGSGAGVLRNLTDPDSRLMKTRRGWTQGYNVQFVVSDDQLVLAVRATNDPFDGAWFTPMTQAAVAAAVEIALARDPQACPGEHGGIGVVLADAGYASHANLTAPGPDRLIALGKGRAVERAAREHPAEGEPPPEATARERMDHRLRTPEGRATYKRRGATVEPGIGNVKKLLARITRRGLAAADAEVTLAALAHNLRKLHRLHAAPT
ncbi:transposase [Actinomycetospora sp. CA-084318]|uniref:transposase n=1 Tax=Actinomycetospora sp. CA-084318 TaxID=3239892 RepID=UPI003D956469